MRVDDVLLDAFGRLPELVDGAIDGLTPEQLRWAPADGANTIGWLVWHLTRIYDYLADSMGEKHLWETGDFAAAFGLEPDPANSGYGHGPADIAAVRPRDTAALRDYFAAVHERNTGWIRGLSESDLDRVVDTDWDPPVTLGVRLVSILGDCTQHVGQAAYLRGLLPRG
ncbi:MULTISPECIES: mycothiol transferase [Catenuloplanes]|uniref:Damage-inducible protein DinB n=1 Tax=Catenuloplanes niger TaxID=587534 RepID=A0AAE4CRX7_9ACTN|nr:DinB family protein [Catenuloplanes niger]MDR7320593.1 putative damage-inducible protein DinB [Catenuloplanes niger]